MTSLTDVASSPTAVNSSGTVTGLYWNAQGSAGFVWQRGARGALETLTGFAVRAKKSLTFDENVAFAGRLGAWGFGGLSQL